MTSRKVLKAISLLVCAVLAVALFMTGCTTASTATETTKASESVAVSESETAKTAETSASATVELKDKILIGNSQHWGSITFTRVITQGAVDAAKEWETKTGKKIEIITTDSGLTDPSQQARDLEDLAAQKIDGLLVFAGDVPTVDVQLIKLYNANNIPVVITDIGTGNADYLSFIVTDCYLGGAMAAEVMAKTMPKGSKVVCFQVNASSYGLRKRADGFMDKAKELGYDVIPEKLVQVSAEGGKTAMEDLMAAEPNIGGVFVCANDIAIGAANAIKSANKVGKIALTTFDINDIVLQLVKDGVIQAAIVQDPYFMGYEGVNQLMYEFSGQKEMIKKEILNPPTACTPENWKDYENDPAVTNK